MSVHCDEKNTVDLFLVCIGMAYARLSGSRVILTVQSRQNQRTAQYAQCLVCFTYSVIAHKVPCHVDNIRW